MIDSELLASAMVLAHARMNTPGAREENFEGEMEKFAASIEPFISHAIGEIMENEEIRKEVGNDEHELGHRVSEHLSLSLVLLGRAYEESKISRLAEEGMLNHLCTNCHGKSLPNDDS